MILNTPTDKKPVFIYKSTIAKLILKVPLRDSEITLFENSRVLSAPVTVQTFVHGALVSVKNSLRDSRTETTWRIFPYFSYVTHYQQK